MFEVSRTKLGSLFAMRILAGNLLFALQPPVFAQSLSIEGSEEEGTVLLAGEKYFHTAAITNTGKTSCTVQIISNRTCGCSAVQFEEIVLLPNQTSDVIFDVPTDSLDSAGQSVSRFVAKTKEFGVIAVDGEIRFPVVSKVFYPKSMEVPSFSLSSKNDSGTTVEVPFEFQSAPKEIFVDGYGSYSNKLDSGSLGESSNADAMMKVYVPVLVEKPSRVGPWQEEADVVFRSMLGRDRVFPVVVRGNVHAGFFLRETSVFIGVFKTGELKRKSVEILFEDDFLDSSVFELKGSEYVRVADFNLNSVVKPGIRKIDFEIELLRVPPKEELLYLNLEALLDGQVHSVSIPLVCVF